MRMASRSGERLTPSSATSSRSRMRSPGLSRPAMMASRSGSTTRSRISPGSVNRIRDWESWLKGGRLHTKRRGDPQTANGWDQEYSSRVAWDPAQYLKFADHRLRPAIDLLNRVALDHPAAAHDLGAGAGKVTRPLTERRPEPH